MSEFSEGYYLLTDDQGRGIDLLRASHTEGFVFPAENGWVTILPRSELGQPVTPLLEANTGTLLNYLFDEDSGWRFALFVGTSLRSHYACKGSTGKTGTPTRSAATAAPATSIS